DVLRIAGDHIDEAGVVAADLRAHLRIVAEIAVLDDLARAAHRDRAVHLDLVIVHGHGEARQEARSEHYADTRRVGLFRLQATIADGLALHEVGRFARQAQIGVVTRATGALVEQLAEARRADVARTREAEAHI